MLLMRLVIVFIAVTPAEGELLRCHGVTSNWPHLMCLRGTSRYTCMWAVMMHLSGWRWNGPRVSQLLPCDHIKIDCESSYVCPMLVQYAGVGPEPVFGETADREKAAACLRKQCPVQAESADRVMSGDSVEPCPPDPLHAEGLRPVSIASRSPGMPAKQGVAMPAKQGVAMPAKQGVTMMHTASHSEAMPAKQGLVFSQPAASPGGSFIGVAVFVTAGLLCYYKFGRYNSHLRWKRCKDCSEMMPELPVSSVPTRVGSNKPTLDGIPIGRLP